MPEEVPALTDEEKKKMRELMLAYDRWTFFGKTTWKIWLWFFGFVAAAIATAHYFESLIQGLKVVH